MASFANMGIKQLELIDNVDEDESWMSHIVPDGATVVSSSGHGASYWTQTARINVKLQSATEGDSEMRSYFIKLAKGDHGLVMVKGEYHSMKALHSISPRMVPEPITFGTFRMDRNRHFFLCDFVDMDDQLPDIANFCQMVADLHQRSMDMSPNGQFGFEMPTCNGKVPQDNTWNESWEAFFIQSLQHEFELEQEAQGPCDEYEKYLPVLYDKVCPRLLRPLETGGRNIRPTLIHGDLWDGNVGVQPQTGQPYIFDASAFWAHNEYDLAIWRGARYRIRRAYVKEYFKHFPPSPPVEDWDDRNLLYSLRADLHDSILYPTTQRFRDLILTSLQQLCEKFSEGYTGQESRKGSSAARKSQ